MSKKKRYFLIIALGLLLLPLIIYAYKLLDDPVFEPLLKLFLIILGIGLILKKMLELIRYEEAKKRETNREKYEEEQQKQKDTIELLKHHLVWEHEYDETKLEVNPSGYLWELQFPPE